MYGVTRQLLKTAYSTSIEAMLAASIVFFNDAWYDYIITDCAGFNQGKSDI